MVQIGVNVNLNLSNVGQKGGKTGESKRAVASIDHFPDDNI